MTMTGTEIDAVEPISGPDEAARIGVEAYEVLVSDLERLGPDEWRQVTVCAPWTVADTVRHLLGAAEATRSTYEMADQLLRGARNRGAFAGNTLDAVNDLQVRRHRHLDPDEALDRLRAVYPESVAVRTHRSRLYDHLTIPLDAGGSTAAGMPRRLNLGRLFRVVYTRDVWLHRVDIARALGRTPTLDAEVDRRIVADVVREWADRHAQPFDLRLTGPAGGRYRRGDGGPTIDLDPAEFCWILSGRGEPAPDIPGAGLLRHRVVF